MNQPTTQHPAPTCAGCAHHEPGCAYCSLLGERRKASDTACGQWTDGKVDRTADPSTIAFLPCHGHPPKITEWRPGCYGAQCMECGGIVGDERQLDMRELADAWNRAMRKRTACTLCHGALYIDGVGGSNGWHPCPRCAPEREVRP